MTVANNTNKVREDGNGSKTAFTFSFEVFDEAELEVYKVVKATGVATPQTITTDYTVSLNTSSAGGTVTYVVAPTALQESFIKRIVPLTQETDIPNVGGIREEQIENQLDRGVMIDQQLQEQIDRCPKLPDASTLSDLELPAPEASKYIGWNADADELENKAAPTNVDYLGNIAFGADASKSASPAQGDIYYATDTTTMYVCWVSTIWTAYGGDGGSFTNLDDIPSGAGRIPAANGPIAPSVVTLTDAANIATNAALGNHFQVTLGGNRTLDNPTNPTNGQRAVWEFIQDGTGSRTITLGSDFIFGTDITSVTLTTTASKKDLMAAIYTGSKWKVVAFVRGYA